MVPSCAQWQSHIGLSNSLAVDKTKKQNARSTVFQLDLLLEKDREILNSWLASDLLVWVHLAPVCGTASKARNIQRGCNDPQPLRSNEYPDGLCDLSERDQERVSLANSLFEYTGMLFKTLTERGILATVENPSGSYFRQTSWMRMLILWCNLFWCDFQACMLGSERPKWTRILANFPKIALLNISCDGKHAHKPWGKDFDATGRQVWATSLEAQYPRKMCIALVTTVLQQLHTQGLQLRPQELNEISDHPPMQAQANRIAAGFQPRPAKIPPLVPEFSKVLVCRLPNSCNLPCALMSKTSTAFDTFDTAYQPLRIPAHSRLLRCTELVGNLQRGSVPALPSSAPSCEEVAPKRVKLTGLSSDDFKMEAAFGLPWSEVDFISKACLHAWAPEKFLQSDSKGACRGRE